MDQELLLIELLTEKEKINTFEQKNKSQILLTLFSGILASTLFFIVLGGFVFRYLAPQIHSLIASYRLEQLARFSTFFGIGLSVFFLLLMVATLIDSRYRKKHFQKWLKKKVILLATYDRIYQDEKHYYLAKIGQSWPKTRVAKNETILLMKTFEDQTVVLGQEKRLLGTETSRIFRLPTEIPCLAETKSYRYNQNQTFLAFIFPVFCLGLFGANFYARRTPTAQEYDKVYTPSSQTDAETAGSSQASSGSDGLMEQQNSTPTKPTTQTNQLQLNQQTDELFLTTNAGSSWQFVPLKPEWLRFGDYTLTTGEIPFGYWMDKTFAIAPDFSWFLYSSDVPQNKEKAVYLLTSTDSGKTWQKNLIAQNIAYLRYRKVTFFKNGQGIFAYSTLGSGGKSAETVNLFTTNDSGKTWQQGGSLPVAEPVQNVSFLTPEQGFVGTREKLYYTHNGGLTTKEALVNLPDTYQLNGLDLFQSPNEITQLGSDHLQGKFYLLNRENYRMYACLFESRDNGETWQFVQQLAEVTKQD